MNGFYVRGECIIFCVRFIIVYIFFFMLGVRESDFLRFFSFCGGLGLIFRRVCFNVFVFFV